MAKGNVLDRARQRQQNEFYTKIKDIERELKYYKHYFKDKVVFCNCDDPEISNFWRYFELQFEELGLKKLIATHYDDKEPSYKLELQQDIDGDGEITGKDIIKTPLSQNGDFSSPECVELLQEADIVVTNPPFTLFKEYLKLLIDNNKKFLIIGSQNNITYKSVFTYLQNNQCWLGYYAGEMEFTVPDYYEPRATRYREQDGIKYRSFGNMCWFTNLDIPKRHENLPIFKNYKPEDYVKFDNYDALFIKKLTDIPCDYDGVMGVPITFLSKYNPDQFEIIGLVAGNTKGLAGIPSSTGKDGPYVNGKLKYGRIFVRLKKR